MSPDGGAVWTSIDTIADAWACYAHPESLNLVFDAGREANGAFLVSVSRDTGATWTRFQLSTEPGLATCLAGCATAAERVYAAGAVGGAGAVFLTEDFGLSWKRARQAPAGPVLDLAVSPGDAGRLLAATAAGAYLSTDAGETWARVCTVPGLRQVEFHPAGADTMAAAGRHGVALSTDAGATWQDLSAGLPTTDVHALAFADCGGTSLLAGTRGEACFRWDFPTAEDEPQPAACRPRPGATVATDELNLPWAGTAEGRATTTMLDACGREVLSLRPGPNDISLLPAGVYVLRGAGAGAGLRRVVVLR